MFLLNPVRAIFVIFGFEENGIIPSDLHVGLKTLMQALFSSFCSFCGSQHNISAGWSGVSAVSNYGVDFLLLYSSLLHPQGGVEDLTRKLFLSSLLFLCKKPRALGEMP